MNQQVTLHFFGVLEQVCGGRERVVTVDRLPASASDVLADLANDVPQVRPYLPHTACAVGDRIITRDTLVQPGEALVLLPPVSGG